MRGVDRFSFPLLTPKIAATDRMVITGVESVPYDPEPVQVALVVVVSSSIIKEYE